MPSEDKHSWSRGNLETVKQCPSCDNSSMVSFTRSDDDNYMPDQWHMTQCKSCKSIWLYHRPDRQSLPRAYDSYYTHNSDSEDVPQQGGAGLAWRLIHGYLNQRFGMNRQPACKWGYYLFSFIEPWRLKLDYYGRHLNRCKPEDAKKLLDIGCGNGTFLTRARNMGWLVEGCEVDPKSIETCQKSHLKIYPGDAFSKEIPDNSFDAITISHVIEHVHEQSELLQRAYDLLRPGGFLWLACPNPESIGLKVFKDAWKSHHPPFHLNTPSQKVLKTWLNNCGFIKVKPIRRGAHAKGSWAKSKEIAIKQNICTPSNSALISLRLVTEAISTFSHRWSEETVITARKPKK